jgi:heme-degrading monooxygenase HmoA
MEPEKAKEMVQLFKKLRSLAVAQPGYISGETLKSADRPNVYLVISSWQSAEDWEQWLLNKERQEIQGVIDSLLGGNTHYELFHYGFND